MSRKLDAAITEALGHEVEWWKPEDIRFPELILRHADYYLKNTHKDIVPHYSSDGNAILELDAEMRKRGWNLYLWRESDVWHVTYEEDGKVVHKDFDIFKNKTIQKAVALAAYHAITGKEWRGNNND